MRQGILAAVCAAIVLAGLVTAALIPRVHHATEAAAGFTIGGPFSLVDGHGKPVTDRDFHGRFMLVYFGYTHCPDACPTALSDIAASLDKLPAADRKRVVPIFITVDPARDTPAMIGDYVAAFGPEFVALTGGQQAVSAAEQEYHVYAQKHPLEHGDYAMDHSSVMYVMGPDGAFLGVIGDGTKPADIAQRLKDFGA